MKWRRRLSAPLVVIAFLLSTTASAHALPASASRVETLSGAVAGRTFDSNPNHVEFLGIPYAAPPTGDNRWRPPQPPVAWKGVRKSVSYGPACPQLPSSWLPEMLGLQQMPTDENCLFVNVWSTNLHTSSRKPVMVWIHGGGNIEGSQEWPPLGPALATQGVVVVTLNYRLGIFGYFSHPALTAESSHHSSGNYGLLDQIAALRWVKANIQHFGGDPDRITVFGASSGSLDVCDLVASPMAAGLFRGAILQSGVCVDGLAPTLAHQEGDGIRIAKDLGIPEGPAALTMLRAIPADQLLHKAAEEQNVDFNPTLDGWVFREQPAITFRAGRQNKVPVLVGSNMDEISIFASPIVGGKSYRPTTLESYREWLGKAFGDHGNDVFSAYPAHADSEAPKVFRELDTDYEFGFGAWLLAQEVANTGQDAFLYSFTYVGSGKFAPLGAFHSEESILLSKKYWTSWVHSPEDETLSNILIGYWTQFAKTLNPNGKGLPPWPPYRTASEDAQELGRHVGQIPVPRRDRFAVFEKMLDEQLKR